MTTNRGRRELDRLYAALDRAIANGNNTTALGLMRRIRIILGIR